MEPVLVFLDGSSSSMFDVFFNDTDSKITINAFEALIDKYEDLINSNDNNNYSTLPSLSIGLSSTG